MAFQTVTRRAAKLRMALTGVSGAGKTLGALYIAYGITGDWGKIALIDTEHERARFYANREDLGTGAFLYASMTPPFSPDRYREMVAEGAAAVGPEGVVIVDSLSHAWNAEGGILDIKDKIAARGGQNSYTAWNEAGREQSKLINAILAVPCHTIVTMRSKMAYAMQEDERGRQKPVKLGLAPVQRDDTEYEFDIVLDINREHTAVASKDTTILDKYGETITPALGARLRAWLETGANDTDGSAVQAGPPVVEAPAEPEPEILCSICGKPVTGTRRSTPLQVAQATSEETGQVMCTACYKIWKKDMDANRRNEA